LIDVYYYNSTQNSTYLVQKLFKFWKTWLNFTR
jgi:hypothetical protein